MEARWKKSCLAIRLELSKPGNESSLETHDLVNEIKSNLEKLRGLCLWEKTYGEDAESDSGNSTVTE